MRKRVDQLLKSHDEPGSFLAHSAEEDFDATLDMSADPASFPGVPAVGAMGDRDLDITLPQDPPPSGFADPALGKSDPEGELSTLGADPDAAIPFIFGQRIAQGGMGAILEANDRKLGRTIAAKVMLSTGVTNTDDQKRFVQEAAVLGKLEHPNIVPIHDLGRDSESQLYYTMKMVQGRTLQDIIDDLQAEEPEALAQYTLERLLAIFRKVCDAMAFAHSRGIIHRDLKPENIMVGEFGEVLVMDWGLSKVLDGSAEIPVELSDGDNASSTGSFTATLQGSVMGTPKYMSPEQAMGEIDEIDQRSDLFSLGGILYALLTLRPPVEGKTLDEILDKVARASITPPSGLVTTSGSGSKPTKGAVLEAKAIKPLPHIREGKVPVALSAVVMKALQLKKEDRYPEVAALSADIENYQNGFATSAEQAGLGTQLKLLIKRNKGTFSTAFAAWVLITGLAVWFVLNLKEKEKRAVAGETAAKTSEAVAVQEREAARAALAESSLLLADSALRENFVQTAESALEGVPEDLRGATWRYLRDQSDPSILKVRGDYISSVAAHPTAPGVFAYAVQSKVKLLNVRNGEPLFEFKSPVAPYVIAISPDAEKIAVGTHTGNGGLAIHSAVDGALIKEWPSERSGYLEFNEDGTLLIQSEQNAKSVQVWDVESGELKWKYSPGVGGSCSAKLIPGSGQIFLFEMSGETGENLFVSIHDGAVVKNFDWGRVISSSVNRDGTLIVMLNRQGNLRGYDTKEEKMVFELSGDYSFASTIAFTPNQERFVVNLGRKNQSTALELRDSKTGTWRRTLTGVNNEFWSLDAHPQTGEVFCSGLEPRVWGGETPATWKMASAGWGTGTFWGSDDLFLGPIAHNQHALLRLKPGGREVIQTFSTYAGRLRATSISRDGNYAFLSGGQDGADFRLLENPGTDVEIVAERGGFKKFDAQCFHLGPRGERVLAISRNRAFTYILNARTVSLELSLKRARDVKVDKDWGTRQAAWLHGGEQVVGLASVEGRSGVSDSEHLIVVWDALTGDVVQTTTHDTPMDALSVSPDGGRFAEAGMDKKVRIRDTKTLEVLQEFRAHNDTIGTLAWHPTLPVLASASNDFTVKIWNLETGECLQVLRSLDSGPTALSFSPTGKRITCSDERYTRIWDLISSEDPRLPQVMEK